MPPIDAARHLSRDDAEALEIGRILQLLTAEGDGSISLQFNDAGSYISRSGEYVQRRDFVFSASGKLRGRTAQRDLLVEAIRALGEDRVKRTRICTTCRPPKEKPMREFRLRETNSRPMRHECKECRRARDAEFKIDGVRQRTASGTRKRA
jgi:hypothetical protein